ncbi:hypothetical protein K466DRAFT_602002 [Polyporus arcularius HHB13444]|uniref:NACHT domain-containing protein n=1 Tax=Polyporus arcularius HHB13444 TaxID=1314778 RepID=A0A5C3PEW4_9APHY|nr:hypothetical protein K466DRAFT_602002 [Polyporus arcularius HHB13444]
MAHPDRPKTASKLSEALDTTLDLTVEGLEAVKDTIVDVLSVPGTGIAFDAVIGMLKKVQAAKSNHKALESLREELKSLVNMLRRLAKVVDTELSADECPAGSAERDRAKDNAFRSTRLAERVVKLASEIQTICADAHELLKRNRFSRFLHSTGHARAITEMKDRIAAARQEFQMENGVMIEDKITEGLRGIKRVIATQNAEEEERVLNSIPRADGALYGSATNAMKARFVEGTRQQIFWWLEEWVAGHAARTGTHPICVLVGEAGTGKSTIASEVSKRLEKQGRLGASFFFTRGMQDLNSPAKFFSTIASQLARSQLSLRIPVADAAREHFRRGALQQLEQEFEDLVRRPLSTLSLSDHAPIFIIVDALDECTEEGATLVPTLLRLLLSAAVPPSPLRVFLTSRPEPHYIHKSFTAPDVQPHVFTMSIQDSRHTVDDDIKRLFVDALYKHETSRRWYETDSSIVGRLTSKSEGLFIYARTAIDFILHDPDDRLAMRERYDILLSTKVATGRAPLDLLYRTILNNVFPPEDQYEQMQDRLKRILGYLVTVLDNKGISPRTLEKLTGMPTAESVPILNKLRSVVIFEHNDLDSRFRIIHASFREFLGDPSRAGNNFYVNTEEAHRRLTEECTSVMRSFAEDWQGSGGDAQARFILQFFTADPTLSHVLYVCAFRRKHLELRGALSQDQDSCQSIGEDEPPPIAAFESWYEHDRSKIVALICAIVARLHESLPAGSKWTHVLSSVHESLSTCMPKFDPDDLIEILSIILDIRVVGNCAVSETAQGQATRRLAALEDRFVPEIASNLKRCSRTFQYYRALSAAHYNFHEAIVAAGLTPGHPDEE